MIIVTGGAGFIGSNLVKELNISGRSDILVVDNLKKANKFRNLVDCQILDYLDKHDFLKQIKNGEKFSEKIDAVFHQGACTNTTELDGNYLIENNYNYSKTLFNYCLAEHIPFIYASSAAIYGLNKNFKEIPENEKPINMYGYSKFLFDQYVQRFLPNPKSQIVGLRYFNVYGPNEFHKEKMASVILHGFEQFKKTGQINLFGEYDGYQAGEQQRDFIHVADVVKVNLWFLENQAQSGIFNLGTGKNNSYNDLARFIISYYQKGKIKYTPFPEHLKNFYQSFTCADLAKLREAGFNQEFISLDAGIKKYLAWLEKNYFYI